MEEEDKKRENRLPLKWGQTVEKKSVLKNLRRMGKGLCLTETAHRVLALGAVATEPAMA